jgi:urease accessory protein
MFSRILGLCSIAAAGMVLASPASAHEQAGVGGGLVSGLLHPLTGLDHLIAMVAVGLWGAQLGAPAIWVLPITFPIVMALGGVLGVLRIPLPMPEVAIALSALVLGIVIAMRLRLPFVVAAAIVGVFAVFHGHAHGLELPGSASPLAYGIGFVTSTGLLHLSGITIGTLTRWSTGELFVQSLGAGIALLGGYFLAQSLGAVA